MHRVFFLDDDLNELTTLKEHLETALPVQVIPVSNSDIGMRLVSDHAELFSAYILDIEMAGQKYSGIQIAEEIRRHPGCALIPIIFLTSYTHYGAGKLRYIHYYDFFQKPCEVVKIAHSLSEALSLKSSSKEPTHSEYITIESKKLSVKWNLSNISCIEISGSNLLITNLLGEEFTYHVKPNVFSTICKIISGMEKPFLQQIHRSVIINVNRVKTIDWHKNYANVWLFNVNHWKPAGKTYLHILNR